GAACAADVARSAVFGQGVQLDVAADAQHVLDAGDQRTVGVEPVVLELRAAELRAAHEAEGELDHRAKSSAPTVDALPRRRQGRFSPSLRQARGGLAAGGRTWG